jgi:hypothetical protein
MTLATHEADAAFADLICADQEWLRAEFDALISASFGAPPERQRPAPPPVPPSGGPGWPVLPAVASAVGPAHPVSGPGHRRQRSPPRWCQSDEQCASPR